MPVGNIKKGGFRLLSEAMSSFNLIIELSKQSVHGSQNYKYIATDLTVLKTKY